MKKVILNDESTGVTSLNDIDNDNIYVLVDDIKNVYIAKSFKDLSDEYGCDYKYTFMSLDDVDSEADDYSDSLEELIKKQLNDGQKVHEFDNVIEFSTWLYKFYS